MTDREKVLEGLADIAEHCERMLATCYSGDTSLYEGLRDKAKMALGFLAARMIPFEEIGELKPGDLVWFEKSGGYEGTRYAPIPAIVSYSYNEVMGFYNTADRAFLAYNRAVCGWRLWTNEPTYQQRTEAKWNEMF